MTDETHEWAAQLQQSEREHLKGWRPQPLQRPVRPTIHYTQLQADTSGGPISREWNFYRREVGKLLAEGHDGKWVLIQDEELVGIWDTEEEANRVRLERFLMKPVLMHQIREWEPVYRCSSLLRPWRS